MKLPISLGIKPALITAGVLLALIVALLFNLRLANAAADTALADQGKAESAQDAAETERDSWKEKAASAIAANRAYDVIFEQQRKAAEEQQRMADQQAQQAERAIAASKAKAAAADKELTEFRRLFGQRPASCEAALQSLDRACPVWRY